MNFVLILDRRETNFESELRKYDVEVAVTELEYGDVMFTGQGERGECMVGCERKKLSDLINSMKDRRLSGHQLRGMWKAYDYCFLFAEGMWRPGQGGCIEELQGRDWTPFYTKGQSTAISYRQLASYLTTLELRGNVVVRRTSYARETAAQYVALWHWFNDKTWEQHHSHDQVYAVGPTIPPKKGHGGGWGRQHEHDEKFGRGRASTLVNSSAKDPTTLWRMAAQLAGIDRRSQQVAAHFKTVRNMSLAGLHPTLRAQVDAWFESHPKSAEQAWREIDGIGSVTAQAAIRCIVEEGA